MSAKTIGSTPLPDTRQPRPFVSKQKDAKVAFPTCVLAASEMICRSFRRRGSSGVLFPGWPASCFSVLSQRDIYGTFCLGPICPSKAGPRREYALPWCQRKNAPFAVNLYEENQIPSQSIRRHCKQETPAGVSCGRDSVIRQTPGNSVFCLLFHAGKSKWPRAPA